MRLCDFVRLTLCDCAIDSVRLCDSHGSHGSWLMALMVLNRERERLVIIRDHESSRMARAAKIDDKIRKLFQTANEAKVQDVLKTKQRLLRQCEKEKQQRDKAKEKEKKRRKKEERVRAQAEKRAPAQPELLAPAQAPAAALAPAPAGAPAPAPALAQAPEPAPASAYSVGRADSSGKRQLQDLDTGVDTPPSAKVFRSRVKYPTPPQAPTNTTRSGRVKGKGHAEPMNNVLSVSSAFH